MFTIARDFHFPASTKVVALSGLVRHPSPAIPAKDCSPDLIRDADKLTQPTNLARAEYWYTVQVAWL